MSRIPEPAPRADLERALAEQIDQARSRAVRCGNRELRAGPALRPSDALTRAARGHARHMAERGFFQHIDPEGRDSQQRAAAAGFQGAVAENLAWGQTTPEQVVSTWLQSPGHCGRWGSVLHRQAVPLRRV